MRNLSLVIAVSSLWVCGSAFSQIQELSLPHITVTGTAKKEVTPDRLHWNVQVKNTGLDIRKVAELHVKRVAALLDLLKASAIADKDVQTAQMQLAENQVYRRNEYVREGYKAETQVAFRLDDLSKYKTLWMALAGLEGVSVTDVTFDHSKRTELNKETRKLALQAAKEKGAAMAEELGSKIGEPLAIQEDLSVMEGWRSYGNGISSNSVSAAQTPAANLAEGGEPLAAGSIPVTIRVIVTFRLLNPGN